MSDFAIFEFSGLPKTGKTTIIDIVATHLRRCGYNVEAVHDNGTYAPIDKSHIGALNLFLASKAMISILNTSYQKIRSPIIMLIDRGLFDRATFSITLAKRGDISKKENEIVTEYFLMDRFKMNTTGVFVFTASVECVMRRELAFALDDAEGKVMNAGFLEEFRENSIELTNLLSDRFRHIETVDTEMLDGRVRDTARLVELSIEKQLVDSGFHDPNVLPPEFLEVGTFLVINEPKEYKGYPYYIDYKGHSYFRYMNALYSPNMPEHLSPKEVVELCEIRNRFSDITINNELNRRIVAKTTNFIKHFERNEQNVSILDFGCGNGLSTALLQREFPEQQVVGCDPSEISIEQARAGGLNCFRIIPGTSWNREETYQLCTAFFVMHFDIPVADLIELRRHMDYDDSFVFNLYNTGVDQMRVK